jgi:hypothetical protein
VAVLPAALLFGWMYETQGAERALVASATLTAIAVVLWVGWE